MFQSGNVLFSTDGTWSSTAHATVDGLDFGVTNIYSTSADKYTNRASSHLFSMLKNDKRTDEKEQAIGQFLEFIRQNSIEWAKAGQIVASKQVIESPGTVIIFSHSLPPTKRNRILVHLHLRVLSIRSGGCGYICADIVRGNVDIDETLATMQKFVEDKIAEGNSLCKVNDSRAD